MEETEQREILETIARDEQTNATARATAIRALRTVERDHETDELVDELDRLIAGQGRWLRPEEGGSPTLARSMRAMRLRPERTPVRRTGSLSSASICLGPLRSPEVVSHEPRNNG